MCLYSVTKLLLSNFWYLLNPQLQQSFAYCALEDQSHELKAGCRKNEHLHTVSTMEFNTAFLSSDGNEARSDISRSSLTRTYPLSTVIPGPPLPPPPPPSHMAHLPFSTKSYLTSSHSSFLHPPLYLSGVEQSPKLLTSRLVCHYTGLQCSAYQHHTIANQ